MNVATATRTLQSQSGLSHEASGAIVETIVALIGDRTRDLVTKDHLDMRLAELRGEFRAGMGELRGEIGEVRGEIGELRGEMGELRGEMGGLRADMEKLGGELRAEIASQTKWLFGGLLGTAGLIVALIKLVP